MAFSDEDEDAAFFSRAPPAASLGKRKRAGPGDHAEVLAISSESSDSDSESDASTPARRGAASARVKTGQGAGVAQDKGSEEEVPASSPIAAADNYYEISSDDDRPAARKRGTQSRDGGSRHPQGGAKATQQTKRAKTTRPVRSSSLTPPPALTNVDRLRAQRVAQAVLDRELSAAAHQLQAQAALASALVSPPKEHRKSQAEKQFERELEERVRTRQALAGTRGSGLGEMGEEDVTDEAPIEVLVRGVLVEIPRDASFAAAGSYAIRDVRMWEKPQRFKLKRSTPLRMAKAHFCGQCGVSSTDAERHIIMAYGSVQVFRSLSCAALGIHAEEGQLPCFELYTQQGWDYVCANPATAKALREESARLQRLEVDPEGVQRDAEANAADDAAAAAVAAAAGSGGATAAGEDEEEAGERIQLTLRGRGGEVLKVSTQSQTQIKKLVQAFRTKFKVAADVSVRLMVEGDALEPESLVGSADVESGDVIDVQVG